MVNTVATTFISLEREQITQQNLEANSALKREITTINTQLKDAEAKLFEFARLNNFNHSSPSKQRARLESTVESLENRYTQAVNNRIAAKANLENLSETEGHTKIQNDNSIQSRRELLVTLEAQLVNHTTPSDIQKTQQQIDQINKNIKLDQNYILETTKNHYASKYKLALLQEEKVKADLTKQEKELHKLQSKMAEYDQLSRDVTYNRSLYDGLLKRSKEINVASNTNMNNIHILDVATTPNQPSKPNKMLYLALGGVLGLFIGVVIAFLREFIDDRIKSGEDLSYALGMPVLARIPVIHSKTPLIHEAFRSLRTNLLLNKPEQHLPKSLCITSTHSNEDKPFTCQQLALAFAQTQRRVLLVDADLRKPSLHQLLNCQKSDGISDFLAKSDTSITDYFQTTNHENITFISAGQKTNNASELLSSEHLADLFELAPAQFDLVIINTPPLMKLTDSLIIANKADATLLIASLNQSKKTDLITAMTQLQHAHANVIGSILTKQSIKKSESYVYGETQTA